MGGGMAEGQESPVKHKYNLFFVPQEALILY